VTLPDPPPVEPRPVEPRPVEPPPPAPPPPAPSPFGKFLMSPLLAVAMVGLVTALGGGVLAAMLGGGSDGEETAGAVRTVTVTKAVTVVTVPGPERPTKTRTTEQERPTAASDPVPPPRTAYAICRARGGTRRGCEPLQALLPDPARYRACARRWGPTAPRCIFPPGGKG
jgi:hypothetical protein